MPRSRSASAARSPTGPAPRTAARRRLPHAEAALDLVRLADALLDDRERLEQHADLLERLRQRDEVGGVLGVGLGEVAVGPPDPALGEVLAGRHVLEADQVVDRAAGAPDRGHDETARLEGRGHVRADGLDPAEVLVADDQEVVARRRLAELRGVDLAVRAAQPDADHRRRGRRGRRGCRRPTAGARRGRASSRPCRDGPRRPGSSRRSPPRPDQRPRRDAVAPDEPDRQAEELDRPGIDLAEVDALEDRDARAQQRLVRPDRAPERGDAQVVDPDEPDAAPRQLRAPRARRGPRTTTRSRPRSRARSSAS